MTVVAPVARVAQPAALDPVREPEPQVRERVVEIMGKEDVAWIQEHE
jgi:hypothetical protein